MLIDGVPNLFRDEGHVIAHFLPAFATEMRETPFGMKLLPEVQPHWQHVETYLPPLEDAVATVLRNRSVGDQPKPSTNVRERVAVAPLDSPKGSASSTPTPQGTQSDKPRSSAVYRGVIAWWGEREFPDRKRPGKTYESFAIGLQVGTSEQVLQGEGLKDAIAESKCTVGDRVQVRRLHQVDVPAVKENGEPKLEHDGHQIMWKKWLWKISIANS
jgi:hypothetical protein